MKSITILLAVICSFAMGGYAQVNAPQYTPIPVQEKRPWFAAGETFAVNIFIWSLDHYVAKAEWANISIESVKHNFQSGFKWDDSKFAMNQFFHPYHGGAFFNCGRTNGMNFWESAPYSFGGSLMWELFMETEEPSINDLITTTAGGIMLGEIMYRFSDLVLDDRTSGSERTWREIGATLINPVRGVNRFISGKTKRRLKSDPYEKPPVRGSWSLGNNHIADGKDLGKGTTNLMYQVEFIYGEPFHPGKTRKPFDYFALNLGLNHGLGFEHFLGDVYSQGLLWGYNTDYGEQQQNLIGIFQHYDYLVNTIYEIGVSSVGGGVISKFKSIENVEARTSAHLAGILLGGSNSEYAEITHRDYNLGTGLTGKFNGTLSHSKYGELSINYMMYWIHTLSGADGDELLYLANPSLKIPIHSKWSLGLEYLYYLRQGFYDDFADIEYDNIELRAFVSYAF
jgi:hypothetical protein